MKFLCFSILLILFSSCGKEPMNGEGEGGGEGEAGGEFTISSSVLPDWETTTATIDYVGRGYIDITINSNSAWYFKIEFFDFEGLGSFEQDDIIDGNMGIYKGALGTEEKFVNYAGTQYGEGPITVTNHDEENNRLSFNFDVKFLTLQGTQFDTIYLKGDIKDILVEPAKELVTESSLSIGGENFDYDFCTVSDGPFVIPTEKVRVEFVKDIDQVFYIDFKHMEDIANGTYDVPDFLFGFQYWDHMDSYGGVESGTVVVKEMSNGTEIPFPFPFELEFDAFISQTFGEKDVTIDGSVKFEN